MFIQFALLILVIGIVSINSQQIGDGSVLYLKDGQVQVQKIQGLNNMVYYGIGGIPFGKAPVGDLRFQPPQKCEPWTGINKNDFTLKCVQPNGDGHEDCLKLNAYSTDFGVPNQAVLVWIYGGAFASGSGSFSSFNPAFLIGPGVLIVAINYRVGAFGFLSTEDSILPGNMGIKDQILALQWIQNNIELLGGDPKNVTIFGESAGAASVSFLTISSAAKGLFQRAIMQSGTSLCTWARYFNAKHNAYALATELGIVAYNSQSLLDGLNTRTASAIAAAYTTYRYAYWVLGNPLEGINFAPTIEPESYHAAITKKSFESLKNGDYNIVPTIIGRTSQEAALAQDPKLSAIVTLLLTKYNANPTSVVPIGLNMPLSLKKNNLGLNIQSEYFGLLMALGTPANTAQFVSDFMFNRPIYVSELAMSYRENVFSYIFNYRGSNISYAYPGVGHGDELKFLFYDPTITYDGTDLQVAKSMALFWTNFAKFGSPTPVSDPELQNINWVPATVSNNMSYCWIDAELKMMSGPSFQRQQYNLDLYQNNGIPPFDII
ncbi:unnamed protein product [Brassicogethes aeneus]|uniref:Carboxylesterase type B domain-containing protein n=1 Tax=Brassicogethes aeneus TaxID=1431903 RepID=A0A9P0BAV2_BRAAE|nr:unnamed protein product [Brassicogethes aeneus]